MYGNHKFDSLTEIEYCNKLDLYGESNEVHQESPEYICEYIDMTAEAEVEPYQ